MQGDCPPSSHFQGSQLPVTVPSGLLALQGSVRLRPSTELGRFGKGGTGETGRAGLADWYKSFYNSLCGLRDACFLSMGVLSC